jgi:uncharacterized membrane protein YcaP (DUF421 family)
MIDFILMAFVFVCMFLLLGWLNTKLEKFEKYCDRYKVKPHDE